MQRLSSGHPVSRLTRTVKLSIASAKPTAAKSFFALWHARVTKVALGKSRCATELTFVRPRTLVNWSNGPALAENTLSLVSFPNQCTPFAKSLISSTVKVYGADSSFSCIAINPCFSSSRFQKKTPEKNLSNGFRSTVKSLTRVRL